MVGGGTDEVPDGESEGVVVGTVDEELLEGHGGPGEDVDEEGLEFTLEGGREGGTETFMRFILTDSTRRTSW